MVPEEIKLERLWKEIAVLRQRICEQSRQIDILNEKLKKQERQIRTKETLKRVHY